MRSTIYTKTKIKPGALIILFLIIALPAFPQQDTRYDSGMNLPFNEKAGDVNPQTGNITLSVTDLSLPGRAGMNFSFGRIRALNQSNAYNMYQHPDTGRNRLNAYTIEKQNHMGVGWSTTMPYIFYDYHSSDRMMMSLFFGGNVYEIDQTGVAVDNPARSNLLWYDLVDKRIYEDSGVSYGNFDEHGYDVTLLELQMDPEYTIADQSGDSDKYVLVLKTNDKYWFRQDGKLMMQQDRTGLNRIWYFYDADAFLRLVVDSIGRKIRFSYDSDGNLSLLSWDVKIGTKDDYGIRGYDMVTRSIQYTYKSVETAGVFPETAGLRDRVIDYTEPFVLETKIDPVGNVTKYEYTEGPAEYTFDKSHYHSVNTYIMLTSVTDMYTPDERYKSRRCFEYEVPNSGMYTRYFYNGYMKYYKISREYLVNRHGDEMMDTRYIYHENGEAGNHMSYSTVIEQGNVTTTYTYSLDTAESRYHVLDNLLVETYDGFIQETDFFYNTDRAKILEQVFRQGEFAYSEHFQYDRKGNLKRHEDKAGLVTSIQYDETYSIPVREVKEVTINGTKKYYTQEIGLDDKGRVIQQVLYLEKVSGRQAVNVARYAYDDYGNVTKQTDAEDNTVYTVYDEEYHAFPIKIYQDVTIDAWSSGGHCTRQLADRARYSKKGTDTELEGF